MDCTLGENTEKVAPSYGVTDTPYVAPSKRSR